MKIKTIINRIVIFTVTSLQLLIFSLILSPIPFTVIVLASYLFGFVKSSINLWFLILGITAGIAVVIHIYYVIFEVLDKKHHKEINDGTH